MNHLLSRLSLPDYALVGGCFALLALMVLAGPGTVDADRPAPPRPRHPGPNFWSMWPGALVATIGGGGVLYGLLALYAATH